MGRKIMKKIIIVIALFIVLILLNAPVCVAAQPMEPDFQRIIEGHGLAMLLIDSETGAFLVALAVIIIGLLVSSFLLSRNLKAIKRKNDELNSLYELRRTFLDADDRLIYLKDENLKYLFSNKSLEELFDRDASEIIGRDDFELTDVGFAEKRRETDLEVLAKKALVTYEVEWKNRVYKATKFPVKLLNGEFGVGAYVEDVTEEHAHKAKLQLILDSAAEGIYGIDNNGNCTFCNNSCLKILGYRDQADLIGKNMHYQIHHSRKDGTPFPLDECRIFRAFQKGERVHVHDEVLWRSDGTSFEAEYFSYPQYKDGKIIGAVVTFMDITERKKAEREIVYLSFNDPLTGLYNRRFFEEELKRLDTERNLPLSIIVGDVNGLKVTNDVFGHFAGDMLLKKAADALRKACRKDDIIARWGGDEFIILLPGTKVSEAREVIARIKGEFSKERVRAIPGSISMGCDAKKSADEDIMGVVESAETRMYHEKTIECHSVRNDMLKTIIKTFYNMNSEEREHAGRVAKLCTGLGKRLGFSEAEIERLKSAAYLHDIGKIALKESLLNRDGPLTDDEKKEIRQHPAVGYRILNAFDKTRDLADCILAHHERWDGSGYPKGLRGEEIPIFARIISLAENYDSITNKKLVPTHKEIGEIRKNAGIRFDPSLAEAFAGMLEGLY
jgi:diguanylate cyclase (GGDEF)-like protein/PAS domain S-box-containing protein/putative nucleotidyltransferase with HDIG domain